MDDAPRLSLDSALETLTTFVTEFGLKVAGAILLLVLGAWIAKRIRSGVHRHLGAAGLAVGLALQGTLSNFAAGVMLLIFRPFSVGHGVEIGGTAGSVQEISVFSTVLHTGDNVKVVVPNSQVYGQTIRNVSANPTRRIDLVIGVGYDDDLQVAKDTMLRVLASDARVLADPAPNVQVSELGDSSVDFIVRPWCATIDDWALRWGLLRALKEELEAAGCSIPFPQRDVHLYRAGPRAEGAEGSDGSDGKTA